ncbi:hypothetical protein HK104_009676 [Borealophlyctis nickersoniae]|nr:hypothetical protein HK104_009676 [Borealophlyctis nickersoniae]
MQVGDDRFDNLGIDYFHCKKCNVCMAISLKGKHKCIERNLECDCPICGEYMFTSTKPVILMPCGHCVHYKCHQEYIQTSYQCPTCLKSLVDMRDYFKRIDQALAQQEMPTEYANLVNYVYCNDCEKKCYAKFHFMHHKCAFCLGYNTKVLQTVESHAVPANAPMAPSPTRCASLSTLASLNRAREAIRLGSMLDVQARSADWVEFSLPAVFTIGPKNAVEALNKYARLLAGKKNNSHVSEIVKGSIEGKTRVIAARMTMKEIIKESKFFKEQVIRHVQIELEQFGMVIYNANIGSQHFSYMHEGACNQAKVDVAAAKMKRDIGVCDRHGETKQEIARIDAATAIAENEGKQQRAQAEMGLARKQAECDGDIHNAKNQAKRAAEMQDAILQKRSFGTQRPRETDEDEAAVEGANANKRRLVPVSRDNPSHLILRRPNGTPFIETDPLVMMAAGTLMRLKRGHWFYVNYLMLTMHL